MLIPSPALWHGGRSLGLKLAGASVDRPIAPRFVRLVGLARAARQPLTAPLIALQTGRSAIPAAVVMAPLNPQIELAITGPQK